MEIPFESINIYYLDFALISRFHILTDMDGKPNRFCFHVAISRKKAGTDECEIPVYVPVNSYTYNSPAHKRLLQDFQKGEPFSPVKFINFHVYKNFDTPKLVSIVGWAENFRFVEMEEIVNV
ncbi:MAG: hypothetical protein K5678_05170 [Acetatifactor sp.]|nr:hypothetical protein [Acetatifactor sp.]